MNDTVVLGPVFRRQAYATAVLLGHHWERVLWHADRDRDPTKTIIFFRGQLLELMHWLALYARDLPRDGNTFERVETRLAFAKAALICTALWQKRVMPGFGDHGTLAEGRIAGMPIFRRSIAESDVGMLPIAALGHGWRIFSEYMPAVFPELPGLFQRASGGLTIRQYYHCMSHMASHVLNVTPEGAMAEQPKHGIFGPTFMSAAPHLAPEFARYLDLEGATADELRARFYAADLDASEHLRVVRERPLLRTHDGRSIIIDPVFFTEKALAGPLFTILSARTDEGRRLWNVNDLFGRFGTAFHNYVGDRLTRMYPAISNRLSLSPPGNGRELTDAVVTSPHAAALIEIKASFVAEGKVVPEDDGASYKAHLLDKYGVADDGSGRPKGVAQLAPAISSLADGSARPPWTHRPRTLVPVLLVLDSYLCAPGHAEFLNAEFVKFLVPDRVLPRGNMEKGPFMVVPLIIMTLQDFDILEGSIEEFSLMEFLLDYSRDCPERLESVLSYAARNSRYGDLLRRGRTPYDSAQALFASAIETAFPRELRSTAKKVTVERLLRLLPRQATVLRSAHSVGVTIGRRRLVLKLGRRGTVTQILLHFDLEHPAIERSASDGTRRTPWRARIVVGRKGDLATVDAFRRAVGSAVPLSDA